MIIDEEYFGSELDEADVIDTLYHVGTPHDGMIPHSGRYRYGSGDVPFQHYKDFLGRIEYYKGRGMPQKEIAELMGLSTTELRIQMSVASHERRSANVATAEKLRNAGYSLKQIAEKMGYANDSSVRALLDEGAKARANTAMATAEMLKKQIDEKGMIDVSTGVEGELGVSRTKLEEALKILSMEGYPTYTIGVKQVTNKDQQTPTKVVCPPGAEHKDVYSIDEIHTVKDYISFDGGDSFKPVFAYPTSMDPSRLQIVYAEEGGIDRDGLIEIRPGVEDLSLGRSNYAQVRILVDGTHYLKGMAVYNADLPEGIDVRFNTNKASGTPALGETKNNSVLKPISKDPDNPFGSLIKEVGGQSYYIGDDGEEHLSLINKRAEEGDWDEWAKKLPSQFLAKQTKELITRQTSLAIAEKQAEYDEIMQVTNPVVRKKLLESFADDCDYTAVHLQAAALPGQRYQVILPIPSLKDNEAFAPNYENGQQLALIRYPHGGTFEIPIVSVNNKNKEAISAIGKNALDAVGVNSHVAARLSGADFDGDTVMVIPLSDTVKITSTKPLKGLEGFDPKVEYGGKPEGTFKLMKDTQKQMGVVSNLITDMTLKGASPEELAKAVRHSMVVIDAEKHHLDYKQSEKDNDIAGLKKKYQGHIDPEDGKYHEGAATLISRAKSQVSVPKRRGNPKINEETGELEWKTAYDLEYVNKQGKTIRRTQKSDAMSETRDARTLSTGLPKEEIYADYANAMKGMANKARLETLKIKATPVDKAAEKKYAKQVDSLNTKIRLAEANAPKERAAQRIANVEVAQKKRENPDMSKKEEKKLSQQALTRARVKVGAKANRIKVEDDEWEAIQAHAVSTNVMTKVVNNADLDVLRQKATPRTKSEISQGQIARMKAMKNAGYTNAEIADAVGVSTSTVIDKINS